MMPQLSEILYTNLNEASPRLADAMHMRAKMTGPEFEDALGSVFRWRDSRHLNERFSGLSFAEPSPGAVGSDQQQRRTAEEEHLNTILRVVDETLFAEFGSPRIDPERSRDAYGWLFDQLGGLSKVQLMCATTNYDPSLEMALRLLNAEPDLGFRGAAWQTPFLDASKIEPWTRPTILHLHGAVGWYRREDGSVTYQPPDQPPNATLGRPAVLYPDPDKDPAEEATRELWDLFREEILTGATHLLVLGHSLHDPPLLSAVSNAATNEQIRVGISVYSKRKGQGRHFEVLDVGMEQLIEQQLPKATPIRGAFGAPKPDLATSDLKRWLG